MEIKVNVRKQILTCRNTVVAGSVKYLQAHFYFDEPWELAEKHVIFSNGEVPDVEIILDETNVCTIPWEVLVEGQLYISVVGYKDDDVIISTKLMDNPITVQPHGEMGGGDPSDPTPSIWTRILDYIDSVCEKLSNKVTEFTGDETDTQYPSAKLVVDSLNGIGETITRLLATKLDLAGGAMQGVLNMSGNSIINVGQLAFVTGKILNMNNGRILNLVAPTIPTGAANKQYVDTQDALNELIANKVTTLDNADDVKYPTSLAVKSAIDAIPVSPTTRYKLTVLKANWNNFGFTYSDRDDGAYMDCDFKIPIGVINGNVYTPTTNPAFPLTYDAGSGYWNIDYALSFGKGSMTALYEQTETSVFADKTEIELREESDSVSLQITLLKKFDTIEEAQEMAEQLEQIKDIFTKVEFVYETFVEQTIEITV